MYQIIKVLNNNAFLAKHDEGERILVGKGIGFGKNQAISLLQSKMRKSTLWQSKKMSGQ